MSRKKLIAANWKMYKTPEQAQSFIGAFLPQVYGHTRDEIVICPPYVCIPALAELVRDTNVGVGGQNMFWEKEGAYTGEISAPMLLAVGCTHVIIGHSERRQYFGETDDTVNRKLKAALAAGLTAIVCIGEVLQEREAGISDDVLRRQCENALREISGEQVGKLTIAYEPVWAIGTGKTATPEMAADAHRVIRKQAALALGDEAANKLRILYGGSIKPENAKALMSQEEIDGGLVGGASLDPKSFAAIVKW
ncbi:MAG TPA: triose-phosphate isomerase [Terriglobales bacterium]|nr:triose-phosphate isomerase [Terriglobales bacterium]